MKKSLNPLLYIQQQGFNVVKSKSYTEIRDTAINSLQDLDQWTTQKKMQFYLSNDVFHAFIAKFKQENVGVIIGGLEEEGRVWIELLAVHPAFRRKSVASALIQSLVKLAREKEFRGLLVDVDHDNYSAINFYRSINFKKVGSIDKYYYDDSKAIVFFKGV